MFAMVCVQVVSVLPLIHMDCPQLGGACFTGELRQGVVRVCNRGEISVGYAALEGKPRGILSFDQAAFQAAIPLRPGASIDIRVSVLAPEKAGLCEAEMVLEYAASAESEMRRACVFQIELEAAPGLSVASLRVLSAAGLPNANAGHVRGMERGVGDTKGSAGKGERYQVRRRLITV